MEEQRARKKQRKVLAVAEDDSAEYDDVLSRLPEPLIHHVLSFLPLEEIAKASVVCKSWRRFFSSFPVLAFRCGDSVGKGSIRDVKTRGEKMARFVDATMTRFQEQHLKIDKFGIDCRTTRGWADEYYRSWIDRWIGIAVDNKAHEITIALPHWDSGTTPSLNLVALSGSTNLKSVTLHGEILSWGRLVSACGSLEYLSLSHCRLKEVRISGLPNIKTVSITGCTSTRLVEIEAPSLESFSLENNFFNFFGKRTHPCVVNVNHSPNLKSLTLQGVAENDGWFRDFLSRFQLLRDLTVIDCKSLSEIRISNPLIENVTFMGCTNLMGVNIEATNLRRLSLWTWDGLLPSISIRTGSPLHFRANTEDYVLELRNDIKYGWLGVIACNFEQLSLARRHATQEPVPRAVDGADVRGLIWTPHPATVTAVAGLSDDEVIQLFFDKVTECDCCLKEHCTSYINYADIKIVTGSSN